jgi:hypothetical protein
MRPNKGVLMDQEAEKLYEELGGIDTSKARVPSPRAWQQQAEGLSEKEKHLDRYRILLVELAHHLYTSFVDMHYWEGLKADKDAFNQIVKILRQLDRIPGHDRTIRIRFRGLPTGSKTLERFDYVMMFGDIVVDTVMNSAMVKRLGIQMKHLEGRLVRAFEVFSAQGITTLFIKIPGRSPQSLEILQVCLRVVTCFRQALDNNSPIVFSKQGKELSLLPILDEKSQPDLNLTLVAALNGVSPEAMEGLVRKIATAIRNSDSKASKDQHSTVYKTMFQLESLREKLIRPPIEVNAVKLQGSDSGQAGAWTDTPTTQTEGKATDDPPDQTPDMAMGETTDKKRDRARVVRFVRDSFGSSRKTAARVMTSLYGKDYKKIDLQNLGERFRLITDLLAAMEKNPEGKGLMEGVLRSIQPRMDLVRDEVLDDLVVQDDLIKMWSGEKETIIEKVDENLLKMIDISKERSATKKKIKPLQSLTAQFNAQDYEALAKEFDISVQEAEDIIALLKSCFDSNGDFLKGNFQKNVPEFARYEKKVFEILWQYLKQTPGRDDRLPFLNSLQLLNAQIQQPKKALRVLLADFVLDPTKVSFSDRNAMMLASQFLRKYNKEANLDIEITPEEVLLVKEGLDKAVAHYAAWRIDANQKLFFEKLVTIRKKLIESLDPVFVDADVLPVRYLLALEREVHIFLSLVGGSTAHTALRGAVKVYGSPESDIYLSKEAHHHTAALLQHLAVFIRGFGRLGKENDSALLEEVKGAEEGFMRLGRGTRHEALVRRVMGWVDAAENDIVARNY